MTTATETPATESIELAGRTAIINGTEHTIERIDGTRVITTTQATPSHSTNDITVLPQIGEHVTIDNDGAIIEGWWMSHTAATGRTELFDGHRTIVRIVPTAMLDARRIVTDSAANALPKALRLLQTVIGSHQRWIDNLVDAAHEEADERGWCSDFDDFLAEHGLPRRTRPFMVAVTVTATLHIEREATTFDEAASDITSEEIWDALINSEHSILDWDTSEG